MSRTKCLQGAALYDRSGSVLMACIVPRGNGLNKMSRKMGKILMAELRKCSEYTNFIDKIKLSAPKWTNSQRLLDQSQLNSLSYKENIGTWHGSGASINSEELLEQLKHYSELRTHTWNTDTLNLADRCATGDCSFHTIATLLARLEYEISELPRFEYMSIFNECD